MTSWGPVGFSGRTLLRGVSKSVMRSESNVANNYEGRGSGASDYLRHWLILYSAQYQLWYQCARVTWQASCMTERHWLMAAETVQVPYNSVWKCDAAVMDRYAIKRCHTIHSNPGKRAYARSTFHTVRVLTAKSGLHAGNMKFNNQKEQWIKIRIIICTILPVSVSMQS